MGVMSVREFNSNVSKALSRVEAGESVTLTKRGRPFARIEPDGAANLELPLRKGTPEWQAAYDRMIDLMRDGMPLGGGKVTYAERTE